jgi:hypothetical protein
VIGARAAVRSLQVRVGAAAHVRERRFREAHGVPAAEWARRQGW